MPTAPVSRTPIASWELTSFEEQTAALQLAVRTALVREDPFNAFLFHSVEWILWNAARNPVNFEGAGCEARELNDLVGQVRARPGPNYRLLEECLEGLRERSGPGGFPLERAERVLRA